MSLSMRLVIALALFSALPLAADERPTNWTGDFEPCASRTELLKPGHMDLRVRTSTSNPILAVQFRRAMEFWSRIVDLTWRPDNTSLCSIQLVDGTSAILKNEVIARSQFIDWSNFNGWIAFDPTAPLTSKEMYLTAVHEIGHMLGLKHNPNPNSVMYYLDLREYEVLDQLDLAALSSRHKLRISSIQRPIRVNPAGW